MSLQHEQGMMATLVLAMDQWTDATLREILRIVNEELRRRRDAADLLNATRAAITRRLQENPQHHLTHPHDPHKE